jgi:hypothetical protein
MAMAGVRALPQAFMRHDKVIETPPQPDPSSVAGAPPGQPAGTAPQRGHEAPQRPIRMKLSQ